MTGLGNAGPNVRLGVDCPDGASTFNNSNTLTVDKEGNFVTGWANSFSAASGCIFEEDHAAPVWSHANLFKQSTFGVRGSRLVVRSMANSCNYDYLMNLIFGLDGSIQWQSQLAGFAEARWFNPDRNAWESEISATPRKDLALPIHSHLLNVKVDLDVGGSASNS